ncbi:MAG TPA: hypothetical protein VMW52_02820, partial [Phycisphaerae bacterium]|nr:hypothetical protein [Phycisphaerae bacterium]
VGLMRYLRYNTAVHITVGPFLDKADGITPEVALTVTNCKLTMTKDDDDGSGVNLILDAAATASGGDNDMVHITGDDAGFYDLELTAAQTNYYGRVMLAITDAANHCPVFHEFTILPQQVYDSMILGTDLLQVDVEHWHNAATVVTGGTSLENFVAISNIMSLAVDTSGNVGADVNKFLGTAITETEGGLVAGAITKFFDKTSPTGTINSLPDAVGGAAGGVMIAGSNAAITLAALTVSGGTTLSGNVSLGGTLGITGVVTLASGLEDEVGISLASLTISGNLGVGGTTTLTGVVTMTGGLVADITGNITTVGSVTTKTGYALAATGMDSVVLPADIITAASINTGALTADAFAANALAAATFAASSLNGKGDWNTVVPDAAGVVAALLPDNFADLSITETTGLVKATDEDGNPVAGRKSRSPGL